MRVWVRSKQCNKSCGEWDTHTALTSIRLCGELYGCSCRGKWAIRGQVYHHEEDIMNRIRCRKSIVSTGGSPIPRLEYPRAAEVHRVPYWFRNMSSHHVQKLFSSYQDPDSPNLLLMSWAVRYGRFIKHENSGMEKVRLCAFLRALYLSAMSQSLLWGGTNAEDLIKNPHFGIEMVIIVSWQHNGVSQDWKWQRRGDEFEVIEE